MKTKKYFYSILQLCIFLLSVGTTLYVPLVYAFLALTIVMVLNKMGKGIVLREMMALHGVFVCLFVPLMGYLVYDRSNALSALWVRYMTLPMDTYFGYALPAMSGFVFALCFPANDRSSDAGDHFQHLLARAKELLKLRPTVGLYLLVIGVTVFYFSDYLPQTLQFAFLLFYFASFAGLLYVYFTPNIKYRIPILLLFASFIVYNALRTGMFTIIAYMGITLFSFFFLGKTTRFWKKLAVFAIGAFALLVIQSVKFKYRQATWGGTFEGNRAVLFSNLVSERFGNSAGFLSVNSLFPVYYRTNQGFNVAMVMRRIPSVQPYDHGSQLFITIASSFVPRVLWPDKPEVGGKFNMKYYAGVILRGWSTNVGPLGEAYGSFGVFGGIIYMVILGAFVRWAYCKVFRIGNKMPLILFWIPVLFYQVTYALESDTLQILNSLVKSAVFIWVLTKLIPSWFGIATPKRFGTRIPTVSHQ